MAEITLRAMDEDDVVHIGTPGYSITITRRPGGVVTITAEGPLENTHELILDPSKVTEIPLRDNEVTLEQNLTQLRLPEQFRTAEHIRLIIWERDPETGSRGVLEICEGTRSQMIRLFNSRRKEWLDTMNIHKHVRIEIVPAPDPLRPWL